MDTLEQRLEQRFWNALKASATDLVVARRTLDEITASRSFDDAHVALFEASLLFREYPHRKADALRVVVERCINAADADQHVLAKAFVVASRLGFYINEITLMDVLFAKATLFFDTYAHNAPIARWRSGLELNVAIHLYANRRYAEAASVLDNMLLHFVDGEAYRCWATQAYAYLALCAVQRGLIDDARSLAAKAHGTHHIRLFVDAEIAYATGDVDDARRLARQAYKVAKQQSTPDAWHMSLAQLRLATIYRETGESELFEYASEWVHDIARNDGMPHVLDALAAISNN